VCYPDIQLITIDKTKVNSNKRRKIINYFLNPEKNLQEGEKEAEIGLYLYLSWEIPVYPKRVTV
jgi:hypothetical protein